MMSGADATPTLGAIIRKCKFRAATEIERDSINQSASTSMSRPQCKTLRPEAIRVLISISMLLHQTSAGPLRSSSHHLNLNIFPCHQRATSGAKFRIIEAEDQFVPPDQRLALKILVRGDDADEQPRHHTKDKLRQRIHATQHQEKEQSSSKRAQLRQPYDLTEALKNFSFNDHSGSDGLKESDMHYYSIEDSNQRPTLTATDYLRLQSASNLGDQNRIGGHPNSTATSAASMSVQQSAKRAGPRSELIRTQHRPPWLRPQKAHKERSSILAQIMTDGSQPKLMFGNKKFHLKVTTIAPAITTTELFRLISSAHSPVRIDLKKLNLWGQKVSTNETEASAPSILSVQNRLLVNEQNKPIQMHDPLQTTETGRVYSEQHTSYTLTTSVPSTTTISPSTIDQEKAGFRVQDLSTRSAAPEVKDQSTPSTQRNRFNYDSLPANSHSFSGGRAPLEKPNEQSIRSSGQVMSPEVMVRDEDEMFANDGKLAASSSSDEQLDGRRHVINYTISAEHTAFKRPVTIIRHSPRRNSSRAPASPTTTEMPRFFTVPSRIRITQTSAPRLTQQPSREPATDESSEHAHLEGPTRRPLSAVLPPPQLVRLISKQKHKYDDNVTSPPLTVIDNDAFRLPPNTTAVHNNRLLVRSKPGQFAPARFQVTTEYPYYNPVAGITPPYPTGQQTSTLRPQRPASVTGPNFGLVRPANGSELQPVQNHTTFGAPNIRFPAQPGGLTGNEPPSADSVAVIPNKLNVSVPDDANLVGPNGVPDKLTVDAGEQLSISASGSAVVTSDATLVGRPSYGQTTFTNPDGIVRLSTTRRPNRFSTTKRINIVSANTTVITTNPDELHDVLINSIAGSHQQGHHVSQRPPPAERPGLLASIGKIFNASVATTAIALMTLIKTILIALLVMFLPPIALTAAIVQAVSMAG